MADFKPNRCRNIRELRELAGLKQVELARIAGITQAYLSELENGKKPLTRTAAQQIAEALGRLMSSEKDNPKIDLKPFADQIRIGHTASFYPENIREKVGNIMREIEIKHSELNYLLQYGKEIPDNTIVVEPHIDSIIREYRPLIDNNKSALYNESLKKDNLRLDRIRHTIDGTEGEKDDLPGN